jgi:L-ascorbate metabolism protein UlaG (beta-lactamase superfamily)
MYIRLIGLTCFEVTTNDLAVLIDPVYKGAYGLRAPKYKHDVIVHSHADGSGIDEKKIEDTVIVSEPGEREYKDVFIETRAIGHGDDMRLITRVTAEDIRVLHMSDVHALPDTEEIADFIEETDVLLVPVGGGSSFDAKKAVEVTNNIEPYIVIPYRYKSVSGDLDVSAIDAFTKEIGYNGDKVHEKLNVKRKDFSPDRTEVYVLG